MAAWTFACLPHFLASLALIAASPGALFGGLVLQLLRARATDNFTARDQARSPLPSLRSGAWCNSADKPLDRFASGSGSGMQARSPAPTLIIFTAMIPAARMRILELLACDTMHESVEVASLPKLQPTL